MDNDKSKKNKPLKLSSSGRLQIRKNLGPSADKQKAGKAFSRSLYIAEDIKEGELFTDKNIKSVRPGFGMHPKYYSKIIGKEAKKNFKKGERAE